MIDLLTLPSEYSLYNYKSNKSMYHEKSRSYYSFTSKSLFKHGFAKSIYN